MYPSIIYISIIINLSCLSSIIDQSSIIYLSIHASIYLLGFSQRRAAGGDAPSETDDITPGEISQTPNVAGSRLQATLRRNGEQSLARAVGRGQGVCVSWGQSFCFRRWECSGGGGVWRREPNSVQVLNTSELHALTELNGKLCIMHI